MGFALSDMILTSASFDAGGRIDTRYTGEGEDVSPELSWGNVPEGTKSFAVICHDPDAPLVTPLGTYGFVHWVLYNIPADASGLEEGTTGHTVGVNDFGNPGYGGPMPPPGHGEHKYYFWILALDTETDYEVGISMWELLERAEPHLIGMNRLICTYQRD